MQCNYNSFIQLINFHGFFRNALRCRKTGACRILVPLRYIGHQLRARRALSIFKDVPLRARRVLSLYKAYGDSALLFLTEKYTLKNIHLQSHSGAGC